MNVLSMLKVKANICFFCLEQIFLKMVDVDDVVELTLTFTLTFNRFKLRILRL